MVLAARELRRKLRKELCEVQADIVEEENLAEVLALVEAQENENNEHREYNEKSENDGGEQKKNGNESEKNNENGREDDGGKCEARRVDAAQGVSING